MLSSYFHIGVRGSSSCGSPRKKSKMHGQGHYSILEEFIFDPAGALTLPGNAKYGKQYFDIINKYVK